MSPTEAFPFSFIASTLSTQKTCLNANLIKKENLCKASKYMYINITKSRYVTLVTIMKHAL